jgi:enterochelin esterase-like enzyme
MNPSSEFLTRSRLFRFLGAVAAFPLGAAAQQTSLNSHQINPDQSVTFRYYAPTAKQVTMGLDYDHHPIPLTKGADGVWSLTTGPLQPALHMYSFTVDGTSVLDPLNPQVDPGLSFLTNDVTVPGPPQLWDLSAVPHGVVHHHLYRSKVFEALPGDTEEYYVYTPPGYDPVGTKLYPTLYLLHGWSALADAWLNGGQANLILDNLIAQERVIPMIVVMPLGYGDYRFGTGPFQQWDDEGKIAHNVDLFSRALLSEIVPQVEASYRVSATRADRAIAGLSMGGGQSLIIGLNHPATFGWIGGFSPAVMYKQLDGLLPGLNPKAAPQLLWVSCGTSDDLIAPTRKFVAWIRAKGLQPMAVETPGIHNWPVWRDNLIHFAPLLFRSPAP